MPRIAARPLILALLAMTAALMGPSDAAPPPSLKGQLLIATPAMRDTRFDRAVILMVRHDIDGAMGIVINRPLGEKPLTDLLAAFGDKDTAASGNVRIFLGGPVQPEVSFVIHGADYRRPETLDIDARLAATPASEVVRDIARAIVEINRDERISVVLVEQNSRMALKISNRAYALETGRIALAGKSADLLNNDHIRKLYLGG